MIASPDIIIEVTNYCNRVCKGCYAPNIITTQKNASSLGKFININLLQLTIGSIETNNLTCYVRGGEPTLHPELLPLLTYLTSKFKNVYLETNGEIFLDNSTKANEILEHKFINKPTLKISYDSMHGLSKTDIEAIHKKIQLSNFEIVLAVTEIDEAAFTQKISALSDELRTKCIYQKKASSFDQLITPEMFVVDVNCIVKKNLTNKFMKEI